MTSSDNEHLAPDEAAILAVFDPASGISRQELSSLHNLSHIPLNPSISTRFNALLDLGRTVLNKISPWTTEPVVIGNVLLLRLRKFLEGNAGPSLREASAAQGLAVFDVMTGRVFAQDALQYQYEEGEWSLGPEPHALYAGCFLTHSTLGKGRLLDIGSYKGFATYVIKFQDRTRLISVQNGLPHIRFLRAAKSESQAVEK